MIFGIILFEQKLNKVKRKRARKRASQKKLNSSSTTLDKKKTKRTLFEFLQSTNKNFYAFLFG